MLFYEEATSKETDPSVIARFLKAQAARLWVPVLNGALKPEPGALILILLKKGEIVLGSRTSFGAWYTHTDRGLDASNITHWAPVVPPKE